jgi:TetR/AcrR family transcriptional regulator, transcriptional repressor of bet genes
MPGQKASESERREQILRAAHEVALRQGVDGLTVRAVAARARLSHGLVLFHFKRKDQLVSAVLDRVLATTLSLRVADDVALIRAPRERLRALLRQEVDRLSRDTRQVRLFLEYWALGTRHAVFQAKISVALQDYRAAFRTLTEDVLRAEPARFAGVTPEGLAAVAVSFINGCAVQAMIDPDRFDVEEYLEAVQGILGRFPKPSLRSLARGRAAEGASGEVGAGARNGTDPRPRR